MVGTKSTAPQRKGLPNYGGTFHKYTGNVKSENTSFKPSTRKSPHGGNVKSSIGKKPAR